MKRAVEAGLKVYPPQFSSGERFAKRVQGEMVDTHRPIRTIFMRGYERAQQDIIALIQSRINEILGDAQPKPALRMELQELIKKIEL